MEDIVSDERMEPSLNVQAISAPRWWLIIFSTATRLDLFASMKDSDAKNAGCKCARLNKYHV